MTLLLGLTACSSAPVEYEELDTFAKLETEPALPIPEYTPVPERPDAVVVRGPTGEPLVGFPITIEDWIQAVTLNSVALEGAVPALRASEESRAYLLEAGRLTEQRANYLGRRLAETERQFERERLHHTIEKWAGRAVGLGVLILLGM